MIGLWRWYLAVLVVMGHLYIPWWPASFGVFSFYIISGFLMSLILNEHYGFSIHGFKGFWVNRFLRLYPAYSLACLLSIIVILYLPAEFVIQKNSKMILPETPRELITNITIFGLVQQPNRSSLVPPAWALSIEIFYYFIISIWAGRSKKNAFAFLSLGAAYLFVVYVIRDFDWWYRYFHIGAGALPFAVGVNMYFHKKVIERTIVRLGWKNAFALSITSYILCLPELHSMATKRHSSFTLI